MVWFSLPAVARKVAVMPANESGLPHWDQFHGLAFAPVKVDEVITFKNVIPSAITNRAFTENRQRENFWRVFPSGFAVAAARMLKKKSARTHSLAFIVDAFVVNAVAVDNAFYSGCKQIDFWKRRLGEMKSGGHDLTLGANAPATGEIFAAFALSPSH
jgi:hypothetical protein